MFDRNEAVRNFRLASNVTIATVVVMAMQVSLAWLGVKLEYPLVGIVGTMMVPMTIMMTWGMVAVMRTRKAYARHRNQVQRLHQLLQDEEIDSGSDFKLPRHPASLTQSRARSAAELAMASAARRKLQAEAGGMHRTQLEASNRLYELGELTEYLDIVVINGERAEAEWYLRTEIKRREEERRREREALDNMERRTAPTH